ncbi:MAG: hypothetical protein ACKVTZ_06010 [Bacteroidia bacterium]
MKKVVLLFSLGLFALSALAQLPTLQQKKVGIFVNESKFIYAKEYALPIYQLLKLSAESGEQPSNLKETFLANLLGQMAICFDSAMKMNSYLIQNDDNRKKIFAAAYNPNDFTLQDVGGLFDDTDYFLLIHKINFSYRKAPSSYIADDQIVGERKKVMTLSISAQLIDAKTKKILKSTDNLLVDAWKDKDASQKMQLYASSIPLGKQLNLILSKLWGEWEK